MIKGVVFDMDGVIVDSEPIHFDAWHDAAQIPHYNLEDWKRLYVGRGVFKIAQEIILRHNLKLTVDELVRIKVEKFCEIVEEKGVKRFDGIKELLQYIKDKNLPIAVASSSSKVEIHAVLDSLGIESFFETGVSSFEVENPKPAPDVYLKAVEGIGVNPQDAIAIEDTPTGVKSAKSAGLYTIAVMHTYKEEDLIEANKVVLGLPQVQKVIAELLG